MLKKVKNITFGYSHKKDGSMRFLPENKSINEQNKQNRVAFFSKNKISSCVSADLNHDNNIAIINNNESTITPETDGLITDKKETCLAITFADCLPIFFYDVETAAIGIAHAGWQGVVKKITTNLVFAMIQNFNSKPENIKVYIGPHIKSCHFEAKNDVVEQFKNYKKSIYSKNGKSFIDLGKIATSQLLASGIKPNNIEIDPICTYCSKKFFSYRRDKPSIVKAQIAFIYTEP